MNDIFNMLSPSMRQTVYDMGWTTFSPIQEASIPVITQTNCDCVLGAETAAGKTEAAFLPILSMVEAPSRHQITVLYVSPLKALINDQYRRIGDLCSRIGVSVNSWHGDISSSRKQRTIAQPTGILQTTPESLESLLVNRTPHLHALFHGLKFIVIDELHAFLDTGRGVHLRSLLHRLTSYAESPPRLVGLSATIGDPLVAQSWVNPNMPHQVRFLQPQGKRKETLYRLAYYPTDRKNEFPPELVDEISTLTRNYSAIIFCNTRHVVEKIAYLLNMLNDKGNNHIPYLVHHASVANTEREYVESKLKTALEPLSVVATSTLELGLDIGNLDLVIQVDATWAVDVLAQRLGRCARKADASRIFALFTTDSESLVQSIAVTELYRQGWLEPKSVVALPLDVLWHQALSTLEQLHGTSPDILVDMLCNSPAFHSIPPATTIRLVDSMVEAGFIEHLPGNREWAIGLETEKILRKKEWYAVFTSSDDYTVLYNGKEIGGITPSPSFHPGYRFLLAGKVWQVASIDKETKRVYVNVAADAEAPVWKCPDNTVVHQKVRNTMADILCGDTDFPYISDLAQTTLTQLRRQWRSRNLGCNGRAILHSGNCIRLEAFAGTREQTTLAAMLTLITGVRFIPIPQWGGVQTTAWPENKPWSSVLGDLNNTHFTLDQLMSRVNDKELIETRFSSYLPLWARRLLHATTVFDLPSTLSLLDSIRWQVCDW